METDFVYQAGLSARALVALIRRLLTAQRAIERVLCRYLADWADQVGERPRKLPGGCSDVFDAAWKLFRMGRRRTSERLRIGRALRRLPAIEAAFQAGQICFSRVRELTRVATPENQAQWLDLALTLPLRQLEQRVAEAADAEGYRERAAERALQPAIVTWTSQATVEVRLSMRAEDWALLQRAMEGARAASASGSDDVGVPPESAAPDGPAAQRVVLGQAPDTGKVEDEHGASLLTDSEALAAVARDALSHQATQGPSDGGDLHRSVVLYECQRCRRTELETGAGAVDLEPSAAATVGCGAETRDLRSEERVAPRGGEVSAAVRRAVWLRDRSRCRVPGCAQRHYVALHPFDRCVDDGADARSRCCLLCTRHHRLVHEGQLRIEGDADGELLFVAAEEPTDDDHGAASIGAGLYESPGPDLFDGAITTGFAGAPFGAGADPIGSELNDDGPIGSSFAGASFGAGRDGDPIGSELNDECRRVLTAMGKRGGWHPDALQAATGLETSVVSVALGELELAGRVWRDFALLYHPTP